MGQHGARCSLTIVCTEGEDSGMYACFAHNNSGYASCQAELTVEEGNTGAQNNQRAARRCSMRLLFPALELVAALVFACRTPGVPGERGGAGKKKEAVLCL